MSGSETRRRVAYYGIGLVAVAALAFVLLGVDADRTANDEEMAVATPEAATPQPTATPEPTLDSTPTPEPPTPTVEPTPTPEPTPEVIDAALPRTMTVLTDSVVLGAETALTTEIPGWEVDVLGTPALMIHQAEGSHLPPGQPVGTVAVVALGYNSLWEQDRLNYDTWAEKFDTEADALLESLRGRGAARVVWVTLRELTPDLVLPGYEGDSTRYAWYFPYVNERIRLLPERHDDLVIADWAAVANRTDITYDFIHLNPVGASLMTQTIATAAGIDAQP